MGFTGAFYYGILDQWGLPSPSPSGSPAPAVVGCDGIGAGLSPGVSAERVKPHLLQTVQEPAVACSSETSAFEKQMHFR